MANKVISGLTIAIGADTEKFNSAMKNINAQARTIANDLKTVSQSLKIDPGDAESYANKLKLLQDAAKNASNKVDAIKQAIANLNKQYSDGQEKQRLYNESVADLEDALKRGAISQEDYKKSLEAVKEEYGKSILSQKDYEKAMSDLQRQLESATYEQNRAVNALDEYQRETSDTARDVDRLGDEQKETNQQVRNFSDATNEGTKGAFSLGDAIKAHLTSSAIIGGLERLWNIAKGIANEFFNAGKVLFNFSRDTVSAAAQYEDALGYSDKVFGGYAENVQQWVKDNSEFLRINISDLQVFANNLGTAFSALGLKKEEAVNFSENILSLSADIRAATGKDINEIVDALTRGFTSSTRNFRQFGLFVGEADIKIQALKDGVIEYSGDQDHLNELMMAYTLAAADADKALAMYTEDSDQFREAEEKANLAAEALNDLLGDQEVTLTSSQRAVSLYNLVMERLKFLQGQNKDEASLYNSQLALLNTKFSNLKLTIGEKLLPVFTDLVTTFNNFLSSDSGQRILGDIVAQFEKWGKTIQGMVEDGTVEQFLSDMGERIPQIVSDIGDFVNRLIELVPEIEKLVESLLKLFGIETEAEKTKRTFMEVKDAVQELANQYGISIEEMNQAVNVYAEANGLKTSEVYENWNEHKDKIAQALTTIAQNYDTSLASARGTIEQFAQSNGLSLEAIYANWSDYEPKIKRYAETLGADYSKEFGVALQHLESFANENGLTVTQILSDWETYEPQINEWLGQMVIDAGKMSDAWDEKLNELPESAQDAIRDTSSTDLSPLDTFLYNVGYKLGSYIDNWKRLWEGFKNLISKGIDMENDTTNVSWDDQLALNPKFVGLNANRYGYSNYDEFLDKNGMTWSPYAQGGFARAGQFLRVNDDAGHRLEGFVPFTDGYVMNGNQMDRIVNNNNQRTVGTINLYVNSYGTNVAEVADELGTAIEARLRMSGAML